MNLTLVTVFFSLVTLTLAEYWEERANLIRNSRNEAIGASIVLTKDEEKVNQVLMDYKLREFEEGFRNPESFLAARHFFKGKEGIAESKVFRIIQKIPKGSSLHSHDSALVSEDYLFSLTKTDNLYVSVDDDGKVHLHFFKEDKVPSGWQKISVFRNQTSGFDELLRSQMTLAVDDPAKAYPDLNSVWTAFMNIFSFVFPLICYRPVFEDYFYQALKELYEDNVMYLEFRGLLPEVYELDGTTYGPLDVVGFYYDTLQKFKEDFPDFHGARFIYAPSRRVDNKTADEYVELLKKMKDAYPDFIAGFDLVGQEDLGKPLTEFIPQLLELQNHTKFFFHAGETNWYGESSDLNLFDAVLLNTTRIGHGYGILKHPKVEEIVKERGIALEISPISNQVLKLVDDIRNHPGAALISHGFPVVITCDDPGFWGAKGLSFDWYMAFMGMASKESDLRLLKQLAINSITYSAMDENEKKVALGKWEEDWKRFINDMLMEHFNIIPRDK